MKLYSVTTRSPAFKSCGRLESDYRVFTSNAKARKHATTQVKGLEDCFVRVEELTLRALDQAALLAAFETQYIMDLVLSRKTIVEYEKELLN